jgi:hypothetical protein
MSLAANRGSPAGAFILLLLSATAAAQSLEPRAYANAPVGTNFLLAGATYSEGDVAFDPSIRLEDGQARIHAAVLAYVRSFDAWGRSGNVGIALPVARFEGSAVHEGSLETREISGLGDPAVRVAWNFHGAPALSPAAFAGYRQDLILGASLTVTAPLGQYDPTRLVNLGTNRWSFRPELGASKALGPWILEAQAGGAWFTDNDDFFGGRRLEQEPIYSLQLHVTRQLAGGPWLAFSATHYSGGETRIDGGTPSAGVSGTRAGATFSLPLSRRSSLKFFASSGLYARTGSDFDTFGVAWQSLWFDAQ